MLYMSELRNVCTSPRTLYLMRARAYARTGTGDTAQQLVIVSCPFWA